MTRRPELTCRRRLRFGASLAWVLPCLLLLLTAVEAQAQAGRARVQEGNRLYQDGRFEEAHQKYLEAMAEAPGSPVIPFNDGNALYQSADYQRAMEAYQQAIETGDPRLASAAWYNLGNAMYRQQQLEPALEAYKESLRLNPRDVDAKHNLERVLEQMQEQDQQQQDPDDGEDEQEPQDQEPSEGEGDPEDQQQQQQDEGEEEGEDEQEQDQQQPPEGGEEPPEGEGQPQPREGQMTPEEAERLLDAIDENPEDVNRKPASNRGRRPRKPW